MSAERTPLTRQVGVVAVVLAALVTGQAMTSAFPVEDRLGAPFVRSGSVGAGVDLRYATVSAAAPDGSTVLDANGALMLTTGVWVVVPITVDAVGQPATLTYAAVRAADGRVYRANGSRSGFHIGPAQPGIHRYATVAVELPVEAAVGAHLIMSLDSDQRDDDLADVDLGITAEQARQWADRTKPVRVEPASDLAPTAAPDET